MATIVAAMAMAIITITLTSITGTDGGIAITRATGSTGIATTVITIGVIRLGIGGVGTEPVAAKPISRSTQADGSASCSACVLEPYSMMLW